MDTNILNQKTDLILLIRSKTQLPGIDGIDTLRKKN